MEIFTVDRIEEGIITLEKENMTHLDIKADEIPFEVHEGSIILFDGHNYSADTAEEETRRKRIFEKQRNIFKNK